MVAPSFVCYDFESIAFLIYLQSNRCLSSWHQIPSLMGGIPVYQFNTLYKIHIRKFLKRDESYHLTGHVRSLELEEAPRNKLLYASDLTDPTRSPPNHAFQLTAPRRPPRRRPQRRHGARLGFPRRLPPPPNESESGATGPPGGAKTEMVFVWLTAFFLVVALIVLVIYQVSAALRAPE